MAFIQNGGNSLGQTIYGFQPGTDYLLTYRENARYNNTATRAEVTLGGETVVGNHPAPPVGGTNPYRYVGSAIYTPSSSINTLTFANTTASGDNTLLIDDVALHPIHLYYSDSFNVSLNTNDINPGPYDQARFGGFLGALSYTEKSGYPAGYTQLDHAQFPGALLMQASAGTFSQTTVSPNHNFNDFVGPEGAHYVIEVKVDPANTPDGGPATADDDWAAIIFGSSNQTAWVNGSDGVGFLIRDDGWFQIFDGTSGSNPLERNAYLGDYGIDTDDDYDVRINYFVPAFDDTSPAMVAISVDNTLIHSFTTDSGFAENFINFAAYSHQNTTYSAFDDLRVWSTAVPEPGTFLLAGLGGLCLVGYGWRRKRGARQE